MPVTWAVPFCGCVVVVGAPVVVAPASLAFTSTVTAVPAVVTAESGSGPGSTVTVIVAASHSAGTPSSQPLTTKLSSPVNS